MQVINLITQRKDENKKKRDVPYSGFKTQSFFSINIPQISERTKILS